MGKKLAHSRLRERFAGRGYVMSRAKQEESTSVACHQLVLQAPPQHKILGGEFWTSVDLHLRRDLKSDKEVNTGMILLQLYLAPQSKTFSVF